MKGQAGDYAHSELLKMREFIGYVCLRLLWFIVDTYLLKHYVQCTCVHMYVHCIVHTTSDKKMNRNMFLISCQQI